MILLFFGPPGVGKGTQAKFISNELKITHLSTGDILRNQLSKKNKLSLKLKRIMDSGQLVSDTNLNLIVSERLEENDCERGFVLDGYPRTMSQVIFLNNFLKKKNLTLTHIFDLYIENKIIIKRILKRAIVEGRGDDSEDTIKTRILKYTLETKPVSDFYKKQYNSKYYSINGNQEIVKLNSEILKIVKKQ